MDEKVTGDVQELVAGRSDAAGTVKKDRWKDTTSKIAIGVVAGAVVMALGFYFFRPLERRESRLDDMAKELGKLASLPGQVEGMNRLLHDHAQFRGETRSHLEHIKSRLDRASKLSEDNVSALQTLSAQMTVVDSGIANVGNHYRELYEDFKSYKITLAKTELGGPFLSAVVTTKPVRDENDLSCYKVHVIDSQAGTVQTFSEATKSDPELETEKSALIGKAVMTDRTCSRLSQIERWSHNAEQKIDLPDYVDGEASVVLRSTKAGEFVKLLNRPGSEPAAWKTREKLLCVHDLARELVFHKEQYSVSGDQRPAYSDTKKQLSTLLSLGNLDLEAGEAGGAVAAFQKALEVALVTDDRRAELSARLRMATAWSTVGRHDLAATVLAPTQETCADFADAYRAMRGQVPEPPASDHTIRLRPDAAKVYPWDLGPLRDTPAQQPDSVRYR